MKSVELDLPSPLQQIPGIFRFQCFIKRDDLIHMDISGNKYRKLKYIIQDAVDNHKKGIITFGGPFSNHIYATAAYAHLIGLPSVGIIRGELDSDNPTIHYAMERGMKTHFISRNDYKNKKSDTILSIISAYPDYMVIPEGGYHTLALKGIIEIIEEFDFTPDYITCSIGTGTTAAGLLSAIMAKGWSTKLLAFAPMKNKSLRSQILDLAGVTDSSHLILIEDYHRGGYAKLDPALLQFHEHFQSKTGITLDPIYTLKMMFGLDDMSKSDYFNDSDTIVVYHSGGLQGWNGFRYLEKM